MANPKTEKRPAPVPEYRLDVAGVSTAGHLGFKVLRERRQPGQLEVDLIQGPETNALKMLFDRQVSDPDFEIDYVALNSVVDGKFVVPVLRYKDPVLIKMSFGGVTPENKFPIATYTFADTKYRGGARKEVVDRDGRKVIYEPDGSVTEL